MNEKDCYLAFKVTDCIGKGNYRLYHRKERIEAYRHFKTLLSSHFQMLIMSESRLGYMVIYWWKE